MDNAHVVRYKVVMRQSANKHVLALLRGIIGCGQKEVAGWVKCSSRAIQSIELGPLKLSESMAMRIHAATGVSVSWLINNDVHKPAVDLHGEPYTQKTFDQWQAEKKLPLHDFSSATAPACLFRYYELMRVVLNRAAKHGEIQMAFYRLEQFFSEFIKEFLDADLDTDPSIDQDSLEFAAKDIQTCLRVFDALEGLGANYKPATLERNARLRKYLLAETPRSVKLSDLVEELEQNFNFLVKSRKVNPYLEKQQTEPPQEKVSRIPKPPKASPVRGKRKK